MAILDRLNDDHITAKRNALTLLLEKLTGSQRRKFAHVIGTDIAWDVKLAKLDQAIDLAERNIPKA